MVPMAHAGDGGGSIRIPASCCGIFGLKPSRGRQPLGPYASEGWDGYVVPGVVSISVRDTAAALDATHGADLGAPYAEPPAPDSFRAAAQQPPGRLRVGYSTEAMLGDQMHPDCAAAVMDAAALLTDLGHEVVEVDLPLDAHELASTYLTIVAAGVAVAIADTQLQTGNKPRPDDFELSTWFLGQVGRELTAEEHARARENGFALGRTIARTFQEHELDVHLSATMAAPPVRVGELTQSAVERAALATLRRASTGRVLRLVLDQLAAQSLAKTPNTQVFNMTGQPAMSVPLFWNAAGLPIGVQFAGRFGDEVTLLRLATQLEQARPWANRLPPLLG
jgi:amidase